MVQVTTRCIALPGEDRAGREVFDTEGAAEYIGCSKSYLKKLRGTGDGPAYHRLFRRKGIIYDQCDIDAWRAARRYNSTTDYPEALG